jgi:hypothetical protein
MPMQEKWENNILGFIPKEDWLDVGFNVTRQNDPVDQILGDEKTDNLVAKWQSIANEYQIPMMAQFHAFDTEAERTFRVPVDTHSIEKGLIKVKINQSERMRELLRSGVQNNQLYDYVINDGVRLSEQVFTRSKVAKNELLATGKVTIKENNLDLTVDYGVPNSQTSLELDFSDDFTSGKAVHLVNNLWHEQTHLIVPGGAGAVVEEGLLSDAHKLYIAGNDIACNIPPIGQYPALAVLQLKLGAL